MNKFIGLLLCLGFLAGCAKKQKVESTATEEVATDASAAPATAEAPAVPRKAKEVLPGAADVRASLAKKEYSSAVGGLMTLKGFLSSPEQVSEYNNLYSEVKTTLMDASQTDPKAAEALMALRTAMMGR